MSVVLDGSRRLVPTIGGSTYVKPSEMDWKPTRFEKVSIKVLYEDPDRGEMTCLLKLEPGAHIPFHKHPEMEQSLVLEGSVEDHDGIATAGDYVWRKPGSHTITTRPAALYCSRYIESRTSTTIQRRKPRVSSAANLTSGTRPPIAEIASRSLSSGRAKRGPVGSQ